MRGIVIGPALAAAIVLAGGSAAAQRTVYAADATVNVGVSQTSQAPFQSDPMPDPEDVPPSSFSQAYLELRPGITAQSGSPRVSWRVGYQFSGQMPLDSGSLSYANSAEGGLVVQTSKFTSGTLSASIAQGGVSYLLSQRAAETGTPELRAPGNPNLITASLGESFRWEAGRRMLVQQSLSAVTSIPQDDFDEGSSAYSGTLSLERVYKTVTFGLEARGSISLLQPLRIELDPYRVYTAGIAARWNQDFGRRWNGLWTAGVEQIFIDNGSQPLAILPTGTASIRYSLRDTLYSLDATHGSANNLQVGTVTLTDQISARGVITLDREKLRIASFSLGFLHNEPLGEASSLVAAGTGNAIQGDAGFTTMFNKNLLGTARYSVAYQFDQAGGIEPALAHIFLVGVTARYTNAVGRVRPLPLRGRRVDGTDGAAGDEADRFPTDGASAP